MSKLTQLQLAGVDSPVAERQPKTDRLILTRELKEAAKDKRLDDGAIKAAHAILVKWAELETKGRLAKLNETQLQGDFLAEVFGEALGYPGPADNVPLWHRIQHEHVIGGETPDAILGDFRSGETPSPMAVIELKGSRVHFDRDRSNGRTAVDQCWDYLNNTPPTCRWGIVSNYVSFRLYERDSTKRAYEHFTLQSLREFETFRQFYVLFHRQGLVSPSLMGDPRAVVLLKRSRDRQREVGDLLYDAYSSNRVELIRHLHSSLGHPVDLAIEMAQRLFDRIMFIAFCEDRGLLPDKTIPKAYALAGFHAVTNPRWQQFKALFRFIDVGSQENGIHAYNGGLFAPHDVDQLDLPDQPWTGLFHTISTYDFADEVNLDVLGHLFERSITELEKLKQVGVFGDAEKSERYAQMPQSVKRKQLGIYYTPSELTSRIVQYTVDELIDQRFAAAAVEHGVSKDDAAKGVVPDTPDYWRACLGILRQLKIVDPACGSGAFLFQAYNTLEQRYHEVIGHLQSAPGGAVGNAVPGVPGGAKRRGKSVPASRNATEGVPYSAARGVENLASQIPHYILNDNLYGVDLSPEAVEITQLALWIRSAAPGQMLQSLAANIVHGNSLVHDPEVHPAGFDWRERFPAVFAREEAGFDCVIGNPPWERIKLQEREFFSLPAPEIATATNAAKRRQLVARLESDDPALYDRYQAALASADALLTYCRRSNAYPLTGRGDINTYAVFAELAYNIVAPHGRVGLLTPSGIASDMTTKDFFAAVAESNRLMRLFDFENRLKKFFPDIDGRFKFCILNFGGEKAKAKAADFVFFAHKVEELEDPARHVLLSGDDIRLLNPNTRTCPIFRTRRDAEITKSIYRRIPVLIDQRREGPTRNLWKLTLRTMFHQTNDAELFWEAESLAKKGCVIKGNRWMNGKQAWLPVYEAKMVQAFDHRAASVVVDQANWMRQGQTERTTLVSHQNPEFNALPRYWVEEDRVDLPAWGTIGFKDITSPTNQRTMIASCAPLAGFTNHFVLLQSDVELGKQLCLLANLNTLVYDYCTRQKIGGVTLNFFVVEQLPTLPPDTYDKRCPWDKKTTLQAWIRDRVLKLTCTSEDMLPLADACGFNLGSFQSEYHGRLNKWDEEERAILTAELDAAFLHLYGIDRAQAMHILSTFAGYDESLALVPDRAALPQRVIHYFDEMSEQTNSR